jgi:hypothetical protein
MYSQDYLDGMQSVISLLQKNMRSYQATWNEHPEMKDSLQDRYEENFFIVGQILNMKKGLTNTEE